MAAASRDFPPEKPELYDYYFEIPENAEVSRVQISTLSSSVWERMMRLSGSTDVTEAPYVIVVSPIIKQKFPNGHKEAPTASAQSAGDLSSDRRPWTRNGHRTYLAPVKCSKQTALDILRLSQTSSEEENWSLEREFPNISDSSILNLEGIKMKAAALCVYSDRMYLLPDSEERHMSDGGKKGEVKRPETNGSQPEAELSTNSDRRHNGLCRVTLRRVSRKPPEQSKSTNANPCTSRATENWSWVSFMEPSTKQVKRKLSYDGNIEASMKRRSPSDHDANEDPPVVQNLGDGSSPQSDLSSSGSSSSPGPQESPPRLSPASSGSTSSPGPQESPPHLSPGSTSSPGPQESPPRLSPASSGSTSSPGPQESPPRLSLASSGSTSSPGPQESPPRLSPAPSSPDPEGPSASNEPCNVLPPVAPAPLTPGPICGDDRSPPHPRATSTPFWSESSPTFENSQEPSEPSSFSDPSLMTDDVRSDRSSFLDMDDTTSDERLQRLLNIKRECEKKVEDIRKSQS